ncbi:MAG TPA: NAD(P)/FAD-dependent oxidoreductase [Puia sp.]
MLDVIIIGGSYSGLAAGMALGRARRDVLIIDQGEPCNMQTPQSHNFITQDGSSPAEINRIARQQVAKYKTIQFFDGLVTGVVRREKDFIISTSNRDIFYSKKIIFATGIRDIMPEIEGFHSCWGISVLHCPYCHGYEVRNKNTGILGNGESGFEFARIISNWTKNLTLYVNGSSTLTAGQTKQLDAHQIKIVEGEIEQLLHEGGHIQNLRFKSGKMCPIEVLYAPGSFRQHCTIPKDLGCEHTEDGYIKTDAFQKTTEAGIYACGDNTNRIRTLANAVASGTTAGMMLNKEIIVENF